MRDIHEQSENRGSRAKLKQRLVGAAVLLIVLAIFLPFIFNHSHLGASATAEQDNMSNTPAATDQAAPQAPLNSAEQSVDSSAAQGEMAATEQALEADEALQAIEVAAETSPAEAQSANAAAPQEQQAISAQAAASASAPVQAAAQAPAPAQASAQAPVQAATAQPQQQPQQQAQQMASAAAPTSSGAPAAQQPAAVQPSIQPAASGSWVVQVASFSNPAHAQQLVNNLRHKGLHAYSRQVSPHMTRVYVGPVKTQQEAQVLQTRIKTEFQLNGLALKK